MTNLVNCQFANYQRDYKAALKRAAFAIELLTLV